MSALTSTQELARPLPRFRTPDMAPWSRAGEEKQWHQRSPSPRPSPPGRGRNVGRPSAIGDHLFSTASEVLNSFRLNSRLEALRKNRCAYSLRTVKRNKFHAPPAVT